MINGRVAWNKIEEVFQLKRKRRAVPRYAHTRCRALIGRDISVTVQCGRVMMIVCGLLG